MKRRLFLGGLGAAGALALARCGGPTYSYRYRLTVEIDTPEGVKSGSSVLEETVQDDTKVSWYPPESRLVRVKMTGEAVFIDLGGGKTLVALLATGPTAQGSLESIVPYTLGPRPANVTSYQSVKGVHEVPARTDPKKPPFRPTIVTFKDLADPASAVVVYADSSSNALGVDRFAEIFGPGYALKRVTIEMTSDPVTRGIEQKLPWINDTKYGKNPLWMQLPQLTRDVFGSLIKR